MGVEGDAVDDRGDQAWVGEHAAPLGERQVRSDRDRCPFLPLGDDLEQQLCAARVDLDVAELVEQEQVKAAVAGDDARQDAFVGGFDELVDQLGSGGVVDGSLARRQLAEDR